MDASEVALVVNAALQAINLGLSYLTELAAVNANPDEKAAIQALVDRVNANSSRIAQS